MRRFVTCLLVLTVGLVGTTSVMNTVSAAPAPSVSDEQWPSPHESTLGYHGFLIEETPQAGGAEPQVSVLSNADLSVICASLTDPACASSPLYYKAILPVCSTTMTVDCIEGISATLNGETIAGTYDRELLKTPPHGFAGSVQDKVPTGASPSLWNLVGAEHSNGAQYLVSVSVGGSVNAPKGHGNSSFSASIVPTSMYQTDCDPRYHGTCIDQYLKDSDPASTRPNYFAGVAADFGRFRCTAWGDDAKCALRHAFPTGIKMQLSVRLSKEPVGWLHGRINNPEISFNAADYGTKVSIAAEPVKVPTIYSGGQWASTPANLQTWFNTQCSGNNCGTRVPGSLAATDPTKRNVIVAPRVYQAAAFEALTTWKTQLGDKATVIPSAWSVRTLSGDEMSRAPSCIAKGKGVTGIVTTNATIYAQGPPEMDSVTKNLNYKVATTHYEPDGVTEFKGTYDLIIREDIANCLYGLTADLATDPASSDYVEEDPYTDEAAYSGDEEFMEEDSFSEEMSMEEAIAEETDTIISDDSSDTTDATDVFDDEDTVALVDAEVVPEAGVAATSRANETISLSGGWFKFSASNFTFSAPTVKVRLGISPSKNILCISGTTVKRTYAVTPSCPDGFSKASVKYCVKGKVMKASIAVKPTCAKGFTVAKVLKCARGGDARRVIGKSPKCPKTYKPVLSIKCVKGSSARVVSAVAPRCLNSFVKAVTITCAKGKQRTPVTAKKPKCAAGYRKV